MTQYTIPTVIDRTPTGERAFDVYSKLLAGRIIFIGTPIDDGVANVVIAQLLHLESTETDLPVSIYLNSPGGSYPALMAVYDTMGFVSSPIWTYCVGQAASTAAILLAAGEAGHRHVLEHSRVTLAQPASEGGRGMVSDLGLQAKEMLRIRSQVEHILTRHTPHDVDRLRADMDREKIFSAQEAVAYGLADRIISKRELPVRSAAA